ncbi:MAG: metal-dependent hydrolase [Kordiimonadaceae bacterium]|nr:metal-dependent hydrolase [Kordiimonadaceae bacterium]MBO6569730.1 metal-dependent hydrolase [Kordiimonadaceae bacterium]MBO6966265.1 metal-dependent hydrolase [Kordiimonadaceae bacterium]
MATIFTHALLPIAAKLTLPPGALPGKLVALAAAATMLPDLDVIAFAFGVPYADPFGHRGFTHSIAFALAIGFLCTGLAQKLNSQPKVIFWTMFLSVLSHPLLDSFTNGGLGVAWFWPFSDARYFMPWQPIEVSPIGIRGFFSSRGVQVLVSEFMWVIAPLLTVAAGLRFWLSRKAKRP